MYSVWGSPVHTALNTTSPHTNITTGSAAIDVIRTSSYKHSTILGAQTSIYRFNELALTDYADQKTTTIGGPLADQMNQD